VYERDFIGYSNNYPDFKWPNGKRLAVNLVFNYECGSEHSYNVDGIVELIGEFPPTDIKGRDIGLESVYEYGTRAAIWRILKVLKDNDVKASFFSVAHTLELNPLAAKAIVDQGHEIVDHGLRWFENYRLSYDEEKRQIEKSIEIIKNLTGVKPLGFYAREPSENTIDIIKELGFLYDSDAYNDDLPYYYKNGLLIIPYTPDINDFHFLFPMNRFSTAEEFFSYVKDSFDQLYEESKYETKMMSVGMHVRITGRPGRIKALQEFIRYLKSHDVWIAKREEIAKFWIENFKKSP
jgi:peptidoglycan/xylan/chitin deacetylase (PgdA/CDA1 family)